MFVSVKYDSLFVLSVPPDKKKVSVEVSGSWRQDRKKFGLVRFKKERRQCRAALPVAQFICALIDVVLKKTQK